MERLDQALGGRHGFSPHDVDAMERLSECLRGQRPWWRSFQVCELLARADHEAFGSEPCLHGCHEADDDACDRGMNAGGVDTCPNAERWKRIRELRAHSHALDDE